MIGATLIHPWNEHLAGEEGVIMGEDWAELGARLEPTLRRL
jgi:hypothetical protein